MIVEKIDGKYIVNITQQEALLLTNSLTNQLIKNDSNVGRLESTTDDDEYFSIFVLPSIFKTTREYKEWIKNGCQPIEEYERVGVFVNYIYCGYEDFDIFTAFSATYANGDFFLCPKCNYET